MPDEATNITWSRDAQGNVTVQGTMTYADGTSQQQVADLLRPDQYGEVMQFIQDWVLPAKLQNGGAGPITEQDVADITVAALGVFGKAAPPPPPSQPEAGSAPNIVL